MWRREISEKPDSSNGKYAKAMPEPVGSQAGVQFAVNSSLNLINNQEIQTLLTIRQPVISPIWTAY